MAQTSGEVTPNDRLLAALAYLTAGLVGILILVAEELRKRPYQRFHAIQSLVFNVGLWIVVVGVYGIFSVVTLGLGAICGVFLWVPYLINWYWAYLAYQGRSFSIPLVTDFIKQQGWG